MHTLSEIKKEHSHAVESDKDAHVSEDGSSSYHGSERHNEASQVIVDGSSKPAANKLITDFFLGSITNVKKSSTPPNGQSGSRKSFSGSDRKKPAVKYQSGGGKHKDIPTWCRVPGTSFRVVTAFCTFKNVVSCLYLYSIIILLNSFCILVNNEDLLDLRPSVMPPNMSCEHSVDLETDKMLYWYSLSI